jgi:hypothetical protein
MSESPRAPEFQSVRALNYFENSDQIGASILRPLAVVEIFYAAIVLFAGVLQAIYYHSIFGNLAVISLPAAEVGLSYVGIGLCVLQLVGGIFLYRLKASGRRLLTIWAWCEAAFLLGGSVVSFASIQASLHSVHGSVIPYYISSMIGSFARGCAFPALTLILLRRRSD